jgi:acyl-CoA synthetase (AMP-forming)/AMP-acid ligase II
MQASIQQPGPMPPDSGPRLAQVLAQAADAHAGSIAFVEPAGPCSYGDLGRRVAASAAWLAARGLRPGQRLALLADNGPAYLEVTFAAAWAGLILVPLNTRLLDRDLAFVLADSGAAALLAGPEHGELARRAAALASVPLLDFAQALAGLPGAAPAPARPPRDEPCQLYYTSGTTGRPKGVMLSHRNVTSHAQVAIAELALGPGDVWAHVAPMFHLADAWATIALTWVGARHVFLPRFEPALALDLFEREGVTLSNLVPTMLNLMVAHPSAAGRRFPALRRILSGGAPIAPKVVERIVALFGCEYVQTYGMTETSPYLTMSLLSADQRSLPAEERLRLAARTGRAVLGVELEVVDREGRSVPRDDRAVGEIRVRGETVTQGYWQRPEATREALREGWLYTGDLATWDARGSVRIVDRSKDMILSGGENVYSTEVEAALYEHPAVLEAAAYGAPDEIWGERVCAAIVLRPGASASANELTEFCRTRLAGYKIPRAWRFLDALPRTGSGKIAKRLLRDPSASEA